LEDFIIKLFFLLPASYLSVFSEYKVKVREKIISTVFRCLESLFSLHEQVLLGREFKNEFGL
jgi:hypothetical protein